ncbi:MAG: alpha/beta hydrolase [Rickettsiales bacterium]|nr:alpha/beta hydrolase [Rickettsiales bacterium]RPG15986.1 MAG: alpha/beta hydrolase [Pelagibacteraceae bacterium TMED195]
MSNIIKKFNLSDDTYIRYKVLGKGKPLMLFHTIRNRLEYSENLSEILKNKFSIYLIDLPGYGDSPINKSTNYNQEFFTNCVIELIKKLQIKDITLAGESIGGVLPATIAVKIPKLIKKIFLFNPYDYDSYFGEGIGRGNFFAKFIMFHIGLPLVGNFFSSLENKIILKNVMKGGFVDKKKFSEEYLQLLCSSLGKKHYVYHFRNVLSNFHSWSSAKNDYHKIRSPIKLIYGSHDWANESDRKESQKLLGLKKFEVIENCGHFSFLENPKRVADIIVK